ncbi:teicoplanin resistance protein VanZ [Exiguobacterium sp. KRL4]|uniref:VanZ family protein n=1 Tax=Exiguobacterium sp. KRL4 TaxID=1914536 RepID=UPI0008F816F2|nr:VanZ family protein [Exiguobacterium sp. KRL4]OIN65681.1 teicoplanin resistance protein VanZ [Exiguobacterium sp. KRL4]
MRRLPVAYIIAGVILLLLFGFSSMSYQQQSLIPFLTNQIPLGWVYAFSFVSFHYEVPISVASLGPAAFVEFFIRKGMHAGLFFILGTSLVHVLRNRGYRPLPAAFFAATTAVTVGVFDEFHQQVTGGRTPLVGDVIIDGTGALFGILLYTGIRLFLKADRIVKSEYQQSS